MNNIREKVGQTVKEARSRSGLTLTQLKDIVDPAYLSRIENGKVPVGLDVLNKIAEAMDMEVKVTLTSRKEINWE